MTGARMTVDELRRKVRRRSKYRAQRCEVDGLTFASKREARRYRELRLLADAGEILNLELQPRWDLHAHGSGRKVCAYVADFRYTVAATGATVVEDAKGVRTPIYRLKRKFMIEEHGITVQEV